MSLEAESDIGLTSVPCSPQSLKRGKEKEESKGEKVGPEDEETGK